MNIAENSSILYYADYKQLKAINKPVTDNCKYYFIHGAPLNAAYILDSEPIYDKDNLFYKQALQEYQELKEKFGDDGVTSFIENISELKSCGVINAKQMLKHIHRYSTNIDRKNAFRSYYRWLDNQKYYHFVIDDDGIERQEECSKYVAHAEIRLGKRIIYECD